MAIATVSARRCVVPLDRPLHLGDAVVAHRDYVIVEVTTSDGVVGRAIGNARNSPVHLFVRDVIAPMVVGLDPLRTENVWSRMYYGCLPIGQRGALMSALSLVDICCWDIKAQSAGMPLATLLGGYREVVDVAIAGGYPDLTPDPADVEEEVAGYVAAGYRAIKVAAHGSPADTARLQAARSACGDDIAADGRPALVVARPPLGDPRSDAMERSRASPGSRIRSPPDSPISSPRSAAPYPFRSPSGRTGRASTTSCRSSTTTTPTISAPTQRCAAASPSSSASRPWRAPTGAR